MKITWDEYKAKVSADLGEDEAFVYRGQRDSSWKLATTVHRTGIVQSIPDLKIYVDLVIPKVHEAIEAWSGKSWNLADQFGLAEFLAYLQHNGYPTPLLDWTYSPYIAAYFAFESINHFAPQAEFAAIYRFDALAWTETVKQYYNIADFTPHVSILRPRTVGNHKLALQQGCFLWSNVTDIEAHIILNEKDNRSYLTKYLISASERSRVMRELSLMGISAVQLMPSIESVCKKALEDFICRLPVGPLK